ADVGDRRTLAAPEALSGVVERIDQRDGPRHLVMRIEDPIPAIVLLGTYTVGDGVDCVLAFYDYGENAHATAERQRRWEDWFSRSFPARPRRRVGRVRGEGRARRAAGGRGTGVCRGAAARRRSGFLDERRLAGLADRAPQVQSRLVPLGPEEDVAGGEARGRGGGHLREGR